MKKASRISMLVVSMIISAIVYNLFLLPLNLVTGGTSGIATITHYVYLIRPSIMLFILSFACIILSFMYLGKEKTMTSIIACIFYPIIVEVISKITINIVLDKKDVLLLVLFAAVLGGIANGLMYKSGYSNGGFPIISQIIYKYFKIPVVKSSLVINIIIVLLGSIFFGTTNVLYAIIYLYINSIIVDKVLLGTSKNKAFYIMTDKEEKVKKYITENLNHTVTTFEVKGAYKEEKRNIMLTVIPSREYFHLTEGIKKIDDKAFFIVTDSYQVENAK